MFTVLAVIVAVLLLVGLFAGSHVAATTGEMWSLLGATVALALAFDYPLPGTLRGFVAGLLVTGLLMAAATLIDTEESE